MRSRRREITPIWSDVRYGTKPFVMNDGESAPVYNFLLLQENRLPLSQENGKHIYLETGNA